ncbi:hypothetical protein GRJ2_001691200 [Grus japonensis]|uniref:Uncharacterized protein n=1 Tax=Grus japonensis TaxID=30415 RepID=A0ABC9X3V9_GRUJA
MKKEDDGCGPSSQERGRKKTTDVDLRVKRYEERRRRMWTLESRGTKKEEDGCGPSSQEVRRKKTTEVDLGVKRKKTTEVDLRVKRDQDRRGRWWNFESRVLTPSMFGIPGILHPSSRFLFNTVGGSAPDWTEKQAHKKILRQNPDKISYSPLQRPAEPFPSCL